MAEMGYGCVFGDCTTQPNHMITTINPASTISTCDEHYPPSLIPLLAAELGVDPTEFYANVERFLAREAKKAGRALADAHAAGAAKGSQGPAAEALAEVPGAGLDTDEDLADKAAGNAAAESAP
jgi:hypothetical protein